jgi:uncharacterized membrane protein required for colicin V production
MKKLLNFFIEPFKYISNRNISEKLSVFFSKRAVLTFLLAFVITAIIIFIRYIFPFLEW